MKVPQLENEFECKYTPKEAIEKGVDLLNALGQGIPGISLLVGYKNNRDFRMMKDLLVELKKQVDDFIAKEKFYERLRTEEGEALLNYGLLKSQVCYRKEQIDKMVDIIIAALAKETINSNDAEVLIDIVSSMNYTEGKFFREVFDLFVQQIKDCPVKMGNIYLWEINKDSLSSEEYGGMFDRFIAKGLFSEEVVTPDKSIKRMFDTEIKCKYTYYGRLFLIVIYGFTETEFIPKHP